MPIIGRLILSLALTLLTFSYSITLFAMAAPKAERALALEECLLPDEHPLQKQLSGLFEDRRMFKSIRRLSQKGFQVNQRVHRGLMVAGHPAFSNYLIKKFKNSVAQQAQTENFLKRVNGARALSRFIKLNNLQHIVVPQKWVYLLPEQFSDPKTGDRSYVLIVEKMDICSGGKDPRGEVANRYYSIDKDILREICIVLYAFRGLDSVLHNLPFTYQNKIAFIDTEKWEEEREEFLPRIKPFLSEENKKYASEVFRELRNQNRAK